MSGPGDPFDPILDALGRPDPAPDLTRPIMARLGYMPVTAGVARRRRRRRRVQRAAITTLFLGAVATAALLRAHDEAALAPSGVTLPAAIGNDVEAHQKRFGRTIRAIRRLAPTRPAVHEPPAAPADDPARSPLEDDVDRSALGPVRWA